MSEIELLLQELKNMKLTKKTVENNADTWSAIRAKDWESAGFADEAEAKEWIKNNEYANL
jgi:hypothetical protein